MDGLPTLIIGIGGTGLKVLQRVKERLQETYYGEVPPHVKLLEMDTALQSPADNFCGVRLNEQDYQKPGGGLAVKELQLIQTNPTYTMDNVFGEAERGDSRWTWVEVNRMKNLLPPAGRSILDGAGAYRPVGRTAFFLNYGQVHQLLSQAMHQVIQPQVQITQHLGEAASGDKSFDVAASKRNVFLVGSLAGGTGSGAILDVASMIRSMVQINPSFSNIVMIGVIALPQFFTNIHDAIGRRIPNTYAGLREMDRFMRGHTPDSPYRMVSGNTHPVTLDNTLLDLCYLVDVQDYFGLKIAENADHSALPVMADMIVAHTDMGLGLKLNATNINVPANYHYPPGSSHTDEGGHYRYQGRRFYSAMNSHTVIFPREDVIKALSLRFLIDLIDTHLIQTDSHSPEGTLVAPHDPISIEHVVEFLSQDNPSSEDKIRSELSTAVGDLDMGIFIRTLLRESSNPGRKYSSEMDNVLRWLIEDPTTRQDVTRVVNGSINEATSPVSDKGDRNQYTAKVDRWLHRYLGPLVDPNVPLGDRSGGEWEQAFGNLVTSARPTMMARVNDLVLRILNQREAEEIGNETRLSMLRPNRVGYALALLRNLKERVRIFEKQTNVSFGRDTLQQSRKELREIRAAVTEFKGGLFKRNPGPDCLRALGDLAIAERQRLLRSLVLQMAQQFGGDIAQEGRERSVLDVAIEELEAWVKTLTRVRERLAREQTNHEARRQEKYAIRSRSYVTDPARFRDARKVEDSLYERYRPLVRRTLLGPDPSGGSGAGFFWELRKGGQLYFDYAILTKEKLFTLNPSRPKETATYPMLGVGSGVEGITAVWSEGAIRLFAEHVRWDKNARVANYIMQLYPGQGQVAFVNQLLTPHSHALTRLDDVQPNLQNEEHYLAVDPSSDDQQVTNFYNWFNTTDWQQTNNQFVPPESDVACCYLTLYHGLQLDNIKGFTECEPAYRDVNATTGCLHLFTEEQLASDYEASIPLLKITAWMKVKRLHPEVVVCLNSASRVRSFAFALLSGLICLQQTGQNQGLEYYLTLPKSEVYHEPIQLSYCPNITHYQFMRETDRVAARMLQAFQTFMLREHAIGFEDGIYQKIDYPAIEPAFHEWFTTAYSRGMLVKTQEEKNQEEKGLAELLHSWRTRPYAEGPSLSPLFEAESKDPRFRDLGIVLYLELDRWRKSLK
jgi:hypothetical protein